MTRTRALFLLLTLSTFTAVSQTQTAAVGGNTSNSMALVPAGYFVMGSNTGPDDEKPEHQVFVKSFLIDVLPVSNADFAKFLNARGLKNHLAESFYDDDDRDARIHRQNSIWQADLGYATHPVNEVSWVGARDYCAWLNKRLPTEAEWEKSRTWYRWKKVSVGQFKARSQSSSVRRRLQLICAS